MCSSSSAKGPHLQLYDCVQQLLKPFCLIPQRLQLRYFHLVLQLLPQRLKLMHLHQQQQQFEQTKVQPAWTRA
jgi:hypothetical protein